MFWHTPWQTVVLLELDDRVTVKVQVRSVLWQSPVPKDPAEVMPDVGMVKTEPSGSGKHL